MRFTKLIVIHLKVIFQMIVFIQVVEFSSYFTFHVFISNQDPSMTFFRILRLKRLFGLTIINKIQLKIVLVHEYLLNIFMLCISITGLICHFLIMLHMIFISWLLFRSSFSFCFCSCYYSCILSLLFSHFSLLMIPCRFMWFLMFISSCIFTWYWKWSLAYHLFIFFNLLEFTNDNRPWPWWLIQLTRIPESIIFT